MTTDYHTLLTQVSVFTTYGEELLPDWNINDAAIQSRMTIKTTSIKIYREDICTTSVTEGEVAGVKLV